MAEGEKVTDMLRAAKDRDVWREMIANATKQRHLMDGSRLLHSNILSEAIYCCLCCEIASVTTWVKKCEIKIFNLNINLAFRVIRCHL